MKINYSNLTFSQLVTKIGNSRFWDLPKMLQEVLNKLSSRVSNIEDNPIDLSGKADLVGGVVPANQLPSYVDDVLEFADLISFPVTGEQGKIYVALDTNLQYRWSGSAYIAFSGGSSSQSKIITGVIGRYPPNAGNFLQGESVAFYIDEVFNGTGYTLTEVGGVYTLTFPSPISVRTTFLTSGVGSGSDYPNDLFFLTPSAVTNIDGGTLSSMSFFFRNKSTGAIISPMPNAYYPFQIIIPTVETLKGFATI